MGNRGSVQTPFTSLVSLACGIIEAIPDGDVRRELMETLAITYHEIGKPTKAHSILTVLIKGDIKENAGRNLSDIVFAARRCGMRSEKLLDLLDKLAAASDTALEKRIDRIAKRLVLREGVTHGVERKTFALSRPLAHDPLSLAYVKNLARRGDTSRCDVTMERLLQGNNSSSCAHAKAHMLIDIAAEYKGSGQSFKAAQMLKRARHLLSQDIGPDCLGSDGETPLHVCPHYAPAALALLEVGVSKGGHDEILALVESFLRMDGGGFSANAALSIRLFLPKQYDLARRLLTLFSTDAEAYAEGLDEFVRHHYERGEVEEMAAFLEMMVSDERKVWSLSTEMLNVEDGYHDNILKRFAFFKSYVTGHLLATG